MFEYSIRKTFDYYQRDTIEIINAKTSESKVRIFVDETHNSWIIAYRPDIDVVDVMSVSPEFDYKQLSENLYAQIGNMFTFESPIKEHVHFATVQYCPQSREDQFVYAVTIAIFLASTQAKGPKYNFPFEQEHLNIQKMQHVIAEDFFEKHVPLHKLNDEFWQKKFM